MAAPAETESVADPAVTEEEMTRADLAELEERIDRLQAAVAENSHRIQVHATIGWTVFIVWLLGAVAGTIFLLRLL